jgi:hypothetical protein
MRFTVDNLGSKRAFAHHVRVFGCESALSRSREMVLGLAPLLPTGAGRDFAALRALFDVGVMAFFFAASAAGVPFFGFTPKVGRRATGAGFFAEAVLTVAE